MRHAPSLLHVAENDRCPCDEKKSIDVIHWYNNCNCTSWNPRIKLLQIRLYQLVSCYVPKMENGKVHGKVQQ